MTWSFGHYEYLGDDPAEVASVMTDLRGMGGRLGSLAGTVEHDTQSIKASWPQGRTGQLAAADAARIGAALDECHRVFASAERDLGELREVLVVGRRTVDELNDAHRALCGPENIFRDMMLAYRGEAGVGDPLGLAEGVFNTARARSGFDSVADIDGAYSRVRAQVEQETGFCNQGLSRLTAQARPSGGQAGHTGGSKYDVSFGLLAAWPGRLVADILAGLTPFPSDPKSVHEAWLALSADQRDALLHGDPARFGNLNGIPAADRNTANMVILDAQLAMLAGALRTLGMEPTTDPKHLEGLTQDQYDQLAAASGLTIEAARQALLLKIQMHRGGLIQAQLLAYEPEAYGGKGRAAIAYGNVDRADNVAFCVPGLNSGLHNFGDVAGDALDLFKQAYLADRDRQSAVVAWQGYDAPGFSQVLSQGNAERGAKLLAADVNAMRITHAGPIGALTVVGHSYGSTTTGLALQREHLDVDQVALIGSPGVGGGARTVTDLHLSGSQVFVGSASTDIVTLAHSLSSNVLGLDTLGADPRRDTFGATTFKAESVSREPVANFSDHSKYYDAVNHSESLYSLAEIVAGHGDRLGADGMLAPARREVGIDTSDWPVALKIALRGVPFDVVVDPETYRTPTAGHDHANDVGTTSP
jgi:pimeloyl-ACP methyl ester carboxylesterase